MERNLVVINSGIVQRFNESPIRRKSELAELKTRQFCSVSLVVSAVPSADTHLTSPGHWDFIF